MTDLSRFYSLRQRIFDLIRSVDTGHHKSYEGALDVTYSFPNIFESNGNPEPAEMVKIELYCYLLCYGRHEEFVGQSLDECMDKLEMWLEEIEQEVNGGYDYEEDI